jgi:tetratricopeptide (TPR) repeat protein
VELLLELHRLMKAGQSESAEADRIRDYMEAPWYQLDELEVARLGGMSADLYTLEPDSPIIHPNVITTKEEGFYKALEEFHRAGDFDGLLALLRDKPQCMEASEAAFERGLAYASLGEHQASVLFFDEVLRLRPEQPWVEACRLDQLAEAGREQEAAAAAESIARRSVDSISLFFAGQFQFFYAASQPATERIEHYSRAIDTLQRSLDALAKDSAATKMPQARKSSWLYLAVALEYIGKRDAARDACLAALHIDPNYHSALMFFGWLESEEYQGHSESQHAIFRDTFPASITRVLPWSSAQAA